MKSIEKEVVEVIRKDKQKFNEELKRIDILIKGIDEVYPVEKPSYNLPLPDTIGKTIYKTLNRRVNGW